MFNVYWPEGGSLYCKETPAQVFSCEYCKISKTPTWKASSNGYSYFLFLFLDGMQGMQCTEVATKGVL